jgi:hypothetical protein
LPRVIPALIGVVALSACGSTQAATPKPGNRPVLISESGNRHTVTIHRGQTLQVVLHNTYWQFAAPRTNVLGAVGAPVYAPRRSGCVPGAGCGTVTARYRTLRTGTATIKATRTSCGEALRCQPGAGSFQVTVVVKR